MSKTTIKKLEKSRVEITTSVPADTFNGYKAVALKSLGQTLAIDGFRPGNAPEAIVEKTAGDARILDEMAQIAISEAYPKILTDEKIMAIGRPEIQLTKLAFGNDLEFTITTAVAPTVTLGDYKKIAQKINGEKIDVVVEASEIDAALLELRQMRAHQKLHDDGVDHHDHDHTKINESDLPELTDEFVKTLGKFESIEDFKTKLTENLLKEKQAREQEKKRIAIIDGIIDDTIVDMPDLLVDFEIDKMMQQFTHDISMMGITMEDYLKRIEKTVDDLKLEWRANAEKRAKMQLILDEIADKEKIVPTDDVIQAEIAKIIEMYKDQHDISEDRVRAYVVQILTNAKVFEFLEMVA
jgi:FKBP-type peptidyl-prolyl cis-trans isomerase (trigger factor)